jgi:hypothetical protein
MAVFSAKQFNEPHMESFYHPSDRCFYCHDPLGGDVWIMWNGEDGQVWFHPGCAKKFSDCLESDWEKFRREYPEVVA